jgi:hypothetical protein
LNISKRRAVGASIGNHGLPGRPAVDGKSAVNKTPRMIAVELFDYVINAGESDVAHARVAMCGEHAAVAMRPGRFIETPEGRGTSPRRVPPKELHGETCRVCLGAVALL